MIFFLLSLCLFGILWINFLFIEVYILLWKLLYFLKDGIVLCWWIKFLVIVFNFIVVIFGVICFFNFWWVKVIIFLVLCMILIFSGVL